MLKILVHGIKDGEHNIDIKVPAEKIPGIYEEFVGELTIKGKMKKLGKRFSIVCEISCDAKLICDRSLKEYTETIKAELKLAYLADTMLYNLAKQGEQYDEREILLHEDEMYIDLSTDVVELLAVSLPMKRIHPEFRDKELEELYPNLTKTGNKIGTDNSEIDNDSQWSDLKKLKFN